MVVKEMMPRKKEFKTWCRNAAVCPEYIYQIIKEKEREREEKRNERKMGALWHWDLDNIDEGKYMASVIPHCKYNSRMPSKI